MSGNPTRMEHIMLFAAPWPLYSRPSIQLGTLKAYLHQQFPEMSITAVHFYLKLAARIGYTDYQSISERTWLAESVYGSLLYPKRWVHIEKLFHREAAKHPEARNVDFSTLVKRVRRVSLECIEETEWGKFQLAGFTISLCQLTASLYFIREIKRRHPTLPIVVGGSMVSGITGLNLTRAYPEIDFLVNGEGEMPLQQLIAYLNGSGGSASALSIPGLITRDSCTVEAPLEPPQRAHFPQLAAGVARPVKLRSAHPKGFNRASESEIRQGSLRGNPATAGLQGLQFSQLTSLDCLPPPDMEDYFNFLSSLDPQHRFFPTLPVEASRGCWWRRNSDMTMSSGCAFCNLNLQWQGYRTKPPDRVVQEIDGLTSRYRTLSVAFMDNVLPLKTAGALFDGIRDLGKDLKIFGEIRADFSDPILKRMAAAGMARIQIGVEALSTRLLGKMNKGTTAIENLSAMRVCETLNISHQSNLILYFPGSDETDVQETLNTLAYAAVYRPLQPVSFWLGLGSPVWCTPKAFGIRRTFNHPNYTAIFPADIVSGVPFPIQAYHGDIGIQRRLWRPVKEKIKQWKKDYDALGQSSPILSFRDGKEFLIIRQKRLSGRPFTHRLVGLSREIYLFCQTPRDRNGLYQRFPGLGEEKVVPFLRMMTDKKLMYEENGRYLSLAVPAHPKFLCGKSSISGVDPSPGFFS